MLELQNVCFETPGDDGQPKKILHDISLTVDDRQFVVITGPNGGGKSTLAKLIMGIEQPTAGRILFEGEDITHASITERANMGIGFALQQPVRFKGLTVRDLLCLSAGHTLNTKNACVYLSEVGLCALDYIDRELNSSLSGGELKRIEIATLIARGTSLSIFDEPEAGIDLWSFQNLIRVFEQMRESTQGSVIIISHQERIMEIANRLIVLSEGRVVGNGTRDEILPELLKDTATCKFYRGVNAS
jgi:ABC-type transport system involved in Fe-S cluster assembly, ATPase component